MNQIVLKPLVEEKSLTPAQVKAEAYKALADLNHYHIGNTAKVRRYVEMIESGGDFTAKGMAGIDNFVDRVVEIPKTPSIMDADFSKEDDGLEKFKKGLHRVEDGVTFKVESLPRLDRSEIVKMAVSKAEAMLSISPSPIDTIEISTGKILSTQKQVIIEPKRRGRPPKAKVEGK